MRGQLRIHEESLAFRVHRTRRLSIKEPVEHRLRATVRWESGFGDEWPYPCDLAIVEECAACGGGKIAALVKPKDATFVEVRQIENDFVWGAYQRGSGSYPVVWRRISSRPFIHVKRNSRCRERCGREPEPFADAFVPLTLPIHLSDNAQGMVLGLITGCPAPGRIMALGYAVLPGHSKSDGERFHSAYAWFGSSNPLLLELESISLNNQLVMEDRWPWRWFGSSLEWNLEEAHTAENSRWGPVIYGTGRYRGKQRTFAAYPLERH